MITIEARNVNDALWSGANMLRNFGTKRDSRNGPVLVAPAPVTTVYRCPVERVMLHPKRDANPFFHLVEALWMLAGRNDLGVLTKFVQNMSNYSDDGGKTQPGAYGFRWRHHFHQVGDDFGHFPELDQLQWVVKRLREDPNDRRVVIQMWDPAADAYAADHGGKDVPCNLIALPTVGGDGRLDLTVYNRSNDMVWGAYGANAVHFSVLQEWIASQLGIPVGNYWQVSNNFHAYLDTLDKAGTDWPWGEDDMGRLPDPYRSALVQPNPMFVEGLSLEWITEDINRFLDNPARVGLHSSFLRQVACPMVMAHRAYKQEKGADGIKVAREILEQMPVTSDWRAGAEIWFNNREARLQRDSDDGVSYENAN